MRDHNSSTACSILALVATCLTTGLPVMAEAPADEESRRLEEVVVTARKRSQSLQDVPISIMAFDSEQLKIKGISNIGDIHSKVPNLYVEPFPQNNSAMRVWIRGIVNKDVQITQDPAVGIYLDGVYIPRSTGSSMEVADVERIEVLRGPQGTLYGRNTTGGAINIITRRAELDGFSLQQELTAGNRHLLTAKTSVNVPLTSELATKFAVYATQRDGFIDNAGPGGDYGDREVLAMRFDLHWHPIERLSLDYAYDRSDLETHNYTMQATERPNKFKGQAEPIKREAEAESKFSEDRFSTMATGMPLENSSTDIEGHSVIVETGFSTYDVKYIGAYRQMLDKTYADLGGGAGSLIYRVDNHEYTTNEGQELPLVKPTVDHHQWSHEVQIHGAAFDKRVEYFVGGYYFEESATFDNAPLHHQFSSPIDGESITQVFLPFAGQGIPVVDAVLGGAADASGARIVNVVSQFYDIDNRAMALFGQATWTPRFWDNRFHLTVGMRHSRDRREATKNSIDKILLELDTSGTTDDITGIFPGTGGKDFDNVTGKNRFRDDSFEVIAEFDISDNIRVYTKAVEAYKSGGFNVRDPQVDGNQGPASDGRDYGFGFREGFDEEKAVSYELGIKSEIWDNRLRVNADVFYTRFKNQQRNDVIAGTIADTKVFNAGKSRLHGLEMNVTARPLLNLFLVLNYGYLDAETVEAEDPFGNDLSHEFPFVVARHTANVSANWIISQGRWGRLYFYSGFDFVDERKNFRKDNLSIEAFGLWSARLGLTEMPAGRRGSIDIAAWGRNLTDEEYALTTIEELPHANRAVVWGEARSYGVDFTYRY